MEILGYGEDALTLWAITNRLPMILQALKDTSTVSRCRTVFRPSFGRKGGERSAQFGEFDFILLAERCLYLGERKWDRSSEDVQEGVLQLREQQRRRHDVFKFYVEEWAFGSYSNWRDFAREGRAKLRLRHIEKPIAPEGSLLASNLQTLLGVVKSHYATVPDVKNVLLYFYTGANASQLPTKAGKDFAVVPLDYSEVVLDGFVRIRV